ncbi:uncharacterized protein LOC128966523 [Oppia nitens]|uniref:uncharacterized protein LOC128966523 n=1 Tax=Oppia nitens TaxID=1686743 RepID=UPI0023DAE7C5|nr:uncharacterized protein LOC128966523 [Oppia nitens]
MSKSCKSVCHPRNVVSIALLSLSFIFLSLITIISSETIAKVPDFESNTGLNNIYRSSESNVIHKNPLRNNLANLRGILSKRANIRYLRNVLDALDTKLEKFQKRNCYINAGMNHNCDFKDLISALNARRFWESTHSPGRRKRHTLSPKFVKSLFKKPTLFTTLPNSQ